MENARGSKILMSSSNTDRFPREKGVSRSVVLNLWVATPLEVKGLSPRGHLRALESTDIYTVIRNGSKVTAESQQKYFYS